MSRTFRRVNAHKPRWLFNDHTIKWSDRISVPKLDPKSPEGRKRLAIYHSDAFGNFKEPGPAWYRNKMTERPQRRSAKLQLLHYIQDPSNTVVILNSKDPLDYWT